MLFSTLQRYNYKWNSTLKYILFRWNTRIFNI